MNEFSEKDLVDFGNYLLSEKRAETIEQKENINEVHDVDIANWTNNMEKDMVTARSYTLRTKQGDWLGQIVLTSDGAFMSVTDYGNFSFAWRAYGSGDFREFLCRLDVHYFAGKMFNGMAYVCYNKQVDEAAQIFAERILPPFQELLKKEIESEKDGKAA